MDWLQSFCPIWAAWAVAGVDSNHKVHGCERFAACDIFRRCAGAISRWFINRSSEYPLPRARRWIKAADAGRSRRLLAACESILVIPSPSLTAFSTPKPTANQKTMSVSFTGITPNNAPTNQRAVLDANYIVNVALPNAANATNTNALDLRNNTPFPQPRQSMSRF